jgi:hypothetical protein
MLSSEISTSDQSKGEFCSEEESRPFLKMKAVDVVLHRKLFTEMERTNIMVEQPPAEPKTE